MKPEFLGRITGRQLLCSTPPNSDKRAFRIFMAQRSLQLIGSLLWSVTALAQLSPSTGGQSLHPTEESTPQLPVPICQISSVIAKENIASVRSALSRLKSTGQRPGPCVAEITKLADRFYDHQNYAAAADWFRLAAEEGGES